MMNDWYERSMKALQLAGLANTPPGSGFQDAKFVFKYSF